MNERPQWVSKYRILGFPEGWADQALQRHSEQFLSKLSSDIEPLENVTVDINDMKDEPVSQFPEPPQERTRIEILILLIDLMKSFSEYVPKRDRDIYEMYIQANKSELFEVDVDFPEFYKFARKVQYTDIKDIGYYKLINQAFHNYVLRSADPERGSVWEIPYNDCVYTVEVKGKVPIVNEEIADPEIYCEIVDATCSDENEIEGQFASIPPIAFNDGRPVKKTI